MRATDELALDEFNVGLYCFRRDCPGGGAAAAHVAQRAGRALPDRRHRPARRDGSGAVAVDEPAPETGEGVNTLAELAEREAGLRARILRDHMLAGVRIVDPATTYVDGGVRARAGLPAGAARHAARRRPRSARAA